MGMACHQGTLPKQICYTHKCDSQLGMLVFSA